MFIIDLFITEFPIEHTMPAQDEPLALNLDPELPEDVLLIAIEQGEDLDKRLALIDELRNMIMGRFSLVYYT